MKKIIGYLFLTSVVLANVTACQKTEDTNEKINIVCTMFAQYDWARELAKGAEDNVKITLLADNGADIHSYQPTADDIISLGNCDLAIYTNGVSDKWVQDAINKNGKDVRQIKMLDIIGENEIYEHHEHDDEEHILADEHVWLSLKNAEKICSEIAKALIELDSDRKEIYEDNLQNYLQRLEILDNEYENQVEQAENKVLLFADRFPFAYLLKDYDISYYAAFSGCSAESETSFDVVAELSKKVDEEALPAVIVIDDGNDKLAKSVIENTKSKSAKIITMKSMQSVKKEELNELTYIGTMEKNLEAVEIALNLRNEEY